MNPLNAYLALEIIHDHAERAERHRRAHMAHKGASTPPRYDAVTIRRAGPDDSGALKRLAELEGAPPPQGPTLVAEVEDRILAAKPLDAGRTLADPFRPTAELESLLETRARHLGVRPRLIAHPLRRATAAFRH
jgi:hypothetical protein